MGSDRVARRKGTTNNRMFGTTSRTSVGSLDRQLKANKDKRTRASATPYVLTRARKQSRGVFAKERKKLFGGVLFHDKLQCDEIRG